MEEANTFTESFSIPTPTIVISTPPINEASSDSTNAVSISVPAIKVSMPPTVQTAEAVATPPEEDRTPLVSFKAPERPDDEAHVFFVNSRGILKGCDLKDEDPESSSGKIHYFMKLMDESYHKENMTIHVTTEAVPNFIMTILDHIKVPFILVSGDSDKGVPDSIEKPLLDKLLNNSYLIRWAAQNISEKIHPKMMEIPIGLHYHILANNPGDSDWHPTSEHASPINQEKALIQIAAPAPHWSNRICKAYTNAHHRLDRFGDRTAALKEIPEDLLVAEPTLLPRSESLKKFTEYAFVASPFGNGYDCHRTWEALCCGSIPIIRGNYLKDIFEDLPVLRVEKWSDVTAELLQKTIEDFSNKTFKYEKLTLAYWMNKIKAIN